MLKNWYTCQPDPAVDRFELCRIQKVKTSDPAMPVSWVIITYYDGKEIYSGTLKQCSQWIENHWVEKRYLDSWQR